MTYEGVLCTSNLYQNRTCLAIPRMLRYMVYEAIHDLLYSLFNFHFSVGHFHYENSLSRNKFTLCHFISRYLAAPRILSLSFFAVPDFSFPFLTITSITNGMNDL